MNDDKTIIAPARTVPMLLRVSPEGKELVQNLSHIMRCADGETVELLAAQFAMSTAQHYQRAQKFLVVLLMRNLKEVELDELRKMIPPRRPRGRPRIIPKPQPPE